MSDNSHLPKSEVATWDTQTKLRQSVPTALAKETSPFSSSQMKIQGLMDLKWYK